jgi:hypothetical protein
MGPENLHLNQEAVAFQAYGGPPTSDKAEYINIGKVDFNAPIAIKHPVTGESMELRVPATMTPVASHTPEHGPINNEFEQTGKHPFPSDSIYAGTTQELGIDINNPGDVNAITQKLPAVQKFQTTLTAVCEFVNQTQKTELQAAIVTRNAGNKVYVSGYCTDKNFQNYAFWGRGKLASGTEVGILYGLRLPDELVGKVAVDMGVWDYGDGKEGMVPFIPDPNNPAAPALISNPLEGLTTEPSVQPTPVPEWGVEKMVVMSAKMDVSGNVNTEENAKAVPIDTTMIWENDIIPHSEKLGASGGANITFYLDETFRDGSVPEKMIPKEVEVKNENKLRIYREYMIWLTLKNHADPLAGNSFDQFLANRIIKQQKGEQMTWPLMAVDTKTLRPTDVNVPLGEIKYHGKLSNNTLVIDEINGGAEFEMLFSGTRFYKLHPLRYVNQSQIGYEKAGIFVNPDDPSKIKMVDVMTPGQDGSIGFWYNGEINNFMFPNQIHKLFSVMSLSPNINQEILAGKIGNLNSRKDLNLNFYTGNYEYSFWQLLQSGKIKNWKDFRPTLNIS